MKSIGTTDEAHQKLKRYCERHGMGMGEYISTSLAYFEKHGINPATHESPAAEMNRLIKRVDQVIAFIRKQESDLLRPMVEAVGSSERRIDETLHQVATASQVKQIVQGYDFLLENLKKLIPVHQQEASSTRDNIERLVKEQNRKQLAALMEISRFLDEKGKGGLLANIAKAFKE